MSEITDDELKQWKDIRPEPGQHWFYSEHLLSDRANLAAELLQVRQDNANYKQWLEESQATCTALGQTAENLAKQVTVLAERLKAARDDAERLYIANDGMRGLSNVIEQRCKQHAALVAQGAK